jgi:hypothetical protein
MDEFVILAAQQLDRIKVLCDQSGLKYLDLAPQVIGAGIAIGFGQTDYVIVSVMGGGNENQLMITGGILNEIRQDRLVALEAANHFNQGNTAYPVFLHDAEVGWALIMQQTHPIEVLLDAPQYFNNCVRALPQVVIECRSTISEKWALGGRPWFWNAEDQNALLIRSMM